MDSPQSRYRAIFIVQSKEIQVPVFPVRRKQITALGGPPNSGKTALIMQGVFNALDTDKEFKVVVCNVEMTPEDLLNREVSRRAGVPLTTIQTWTYRANPTWNKSVREGNAAFDRLKRPFILRLPSF